MTITRIHQAGLEVNALESLALEFDTKVGSGITVVATDGAIAPKTGQYQMKVAAPGTGVDPHKVEKSLGAPRTALRGGYHVRVTLDSWKSGSTSTNPNLITFYEDTTEVVRIYIGTDGKWTASVGGATVTAERTGRQNTYLHFGFQLVLDATVGVLKVFEDGLLMIDYAGNTIGSSGASGITQIALGTTAPAQKLTAHIDDFYIDDTTGESSFGPVPDLRFAFLLPTGAGTKTGFAVHNVNPEHTENWQAVDERPHDGDDSYVKAVTADVVDLYQMEDIELEPGWTINAVIPCTIARKVNAADDTKIKLSIASGNEQYRKDSQVAHELMPFYTLIFERHETDADNKAWDEARVNDMQIGIVSAGTF